MRTKWIVIYVGLLAGLTIDACAQPAEPHRHPVNLAKIEKLIAKINESAQLTPDQKIVQFGYIMAQLKFPQGKAIKVCFINPSVPNESSSPATIERIIALATLWTQASAADLQFDFGPAASRRRCSQAEKGDIRIGFERTTSYGPRWSIIGRDQSTSSDSPTANFYFDDDMLAAPAGSPIAYYFPYTILHEFGHAIGLIHEHQGGDCEKEYDFTALYQTYGWTAEMIDANFRHSKDPGVLQLTPYCKGSIMNYVVAPDYFLKGTSSSCYTPPISQLADCDKRTAKLAYPGKEIAHPQMIGQAATLLSIASEQGTTAEQRVLLIQASARMLEGSELPADVAPFLQRAASAPAAISDQELRQARLSLSRSVAPPPPKGTEESSQAKQAAARVAPPPLTSEQKRLLLNVVEDLGH